MNNSEQLQIAFVKTALSEKTKGTAIGALGGGVAGAGLGAGLGALPVLLDALNPRRKEVNLSSIGKGGLIGGGIGALLGGLAGRAEGRNKAEFDAVKAEAGLEGVNRFTPAQAELLALLAREKGII